MGYATGSLLKIAEMLENTGQKGRRVLDLGSQDVTVFDEGDLDNLSTFVARFGGDVGRLRSLFPGPFPALTAVGEVFSAAGFEYICCDVDRRPKTLYIDFNALDFDQTLYGRFDLVMNAGTTEHLANPVAAFFLMHHLCKVNGILYNEVPLSGWLNHGLNNLTPKFWHTIQWINDYRVLWAEAKPVDQTLGADGNFGGEHLKFITHLDGAGDVSSSIQILYQKTSNRGFVPPFDAVIPTDDGGKALAELVMGSLRPFVACGALSADDAISTTNEFLVYQCLPFRVGNGSWPYRIYFTEGRARSSVKRHLEAIPVLGPALLNVYRRLRPSPPVPRVGTR